jgi:hypothetical protein
VPEHRKLVVDATRKLAHAVQRVIVNTHQRDALAHEFPCQVGHAKHVVAGTDPHVHGPGRCKITLPKQKQKAKAKKKKKNPPKRMKKERFLRFLALKRFLFVLYLELTARHEPAVQLVAKESGRLNVFLQTRRKS